MANTTYQTAAPEPMTVLELYDSLNLPLRRIERLLDRIDRFTDELQTAELGGEEAFADLDAYWHAITLITTELRSHLEAARTRGDA